MPSPAFALQGKKVDQGRDQRAKPGQPALAPLAWAVVPVRGAVHVILRADQVPDGRSVPVWFALDESRPLAFFAGIWTGWTCTRKMAEGEVTCELFAFLTTEPNAEVGPIHPKAMPVILTEPAEIDAWIGRRGARRRVATAVAGRGAADRGAGGEGGWGRGPGNDNALVTFRG